MLEMELREPWRYIEDLLSEERYDALLPALRQLTPAELARTFHHMSEDNRNLTLAKVPASDAADLLERLSDAQGAEIIEDLPPELAADIVDELDSHHQADILGEMDADDQQAILAEMDEEEAEDARRLLEYPPETAGGIMLTEFVSYNQNMTVADVIKDLRDNRELYEDIGVQYAYVESDERRLVGVVRLRDLVLAPGNRPLASIMVVNPIYLLVTADLEEVRQFFDRYDFWGVPVTDEDGRMVGLVRRIHAEEAEGERSERAFLRFSGIISGEEFRSMPLRERSQRRLSWLVLNMGLSILAASVILGHQDTIDELFALVFFMPIICNLSGCSGNQSVAVSIRELTLGLIKPEDYRSVLKHELALGVVNGLVLGAALGTVAVVLWGDSPVLGAVIGGAFMLNTVVAVCFGGLIPLLLRMMKIDPALGAPPILTTMTDMCGFLLVLWFARTALDLGLL